LALFSGLPRNVPLHQSLAYRSRPVTAYGTMRLGLRDYDFTRRAFLSYDSDWNPGDPNGFTAFAGNPGMYFDADGRCIQSVWNGFENQWASQTRDDLPFGVKQFYNGSAGFITLAQGAGNFANWCLAQVGFDDPKALLFVPGLNMVGEASEATAVTEVEAVAETAPSLIGNTSPTQSILKAVYNADTGEIAVQFPLAEGTHAEVAVNAGWVESPNLIGGYLKFSGGKITTGDWVDASGLLPGNPGLVTKAQAATQTLMSGH
jgi:hypothetical protein